MKKIGLMLLFAVFACAAWAQNTVDIYSTGASGSFITGNGTSTTRLDNAIVSTGFAGITRKGYAVFDLSTLPSTAVVTSVELHFNIETITGGGGGTYNTTGYADDLSTYTTAASLYAAMGLGSTLYTDAYGSTVGNMVFATAAAAETFIDANKGNKVSIIWSSTSFRVYTITGETGAATESGTHAPFIRVTYTCPGITSVTATPPAVNPCPDVAFTLTGAATGTIASVEWAGPLGFSSTSLSPTVTTGLPTSGVYTFTATDAAGCMASATANVTVNPAPLTSITPVTSAVFCVGDNATLEAPIVAGYTYQWYMGGTLIPGATDADYVSDTTGNYKVRVTDANGCIATTAFAFPTLLLDTPSITPNGPVRLCTGDIGTLMVNTNGIVTGLDFQWRKNGVDIPGANSQTYVATESATYSAYVAVTSGTCNTVSRDVDVIVNEFPVPTVSWSGTTLYTSSAYSVYQWFVNTVAISGATSSTYVPTAPGSYRVRVSDPNGCIAYSAAYNLVTVGVANVDKSAVHIFPNPATDRLFIDAGGAHVSAEITTIDGRMVKKVADAQEIGLDDVPAGLYMLSVYNELGIRVTIEKFMKK